MTDNFFDLVEMRRAVKDFDDSHEMPPEDLKKILTAAHYAPTAYNIQNYRFVVKQDKTARRAQGFMEACWNQPKASESSVLIILCADKDAWATEPARYWESAGDKTQQNMTDKITSYYKGKERVQLDEVHRSCGMAGMNIMLAALALGYDSCPMDGFDYEAVGKLINLPDDHVISFMIAVGKRVKDPFPRPTMLPRAEIVVNETF